MALITDPDSLNQATEIVFNTTTKTIQLLIAGNLSVDGVTEKTIYSFAKEEWKDDVALVKFPFPFIPITDEFFELQEGWDWADATTRTLIRRGGWLVRNASGNVTEHWVGVAILGAENDDQIYYDIGNGAVDFNFTGNTAEAIQVISDPNGDGNYVDGFDQSANLIVFNRERGQIFNQSSSLANGESSLLAPKLFSLSLSTGVDLNIQESDTNILVNAPYTGMTITYNTIAQVRDIGGTNYNFGIIIDGNNGSLEQIYEYIKHQLRLSTDIDNSAAIQLGQIADELASFTGGTGDGSGLLYTLTANNPNGGGTGVYIDNFAIGDTNRITFIDNTGAERNFPFIAIITMTFNATLQADTSAIYRVFFTDANGNQFGNSNAILVQDNNNIDISGDINGAATIQFDFDFDGNIQGGRTSGTSADITVVAIGLDSAQYIAATATILRSNSNSVSLVANTERNYVNPI